MFSFLFLYISLFLFFIYLTLDVTLLVYCDVYFMLHFGFTSVSNC